MQLCNFYVPQLRAIKKKNQKSCFCLIPYEEVNGNLGLVVLKHDHGGGFFVCLFVFIITFIFKITVCGM